MYCSVGPGATLKHLLNISPGIPIFQAVAKHMSWQHQSTMSGGSCHKSPNKAKDIDLEMRVVVKENWFQQINGRRLRVPEDHAKDVVTLGLSNLSQKGAFQCWWEVRLFTQSHEEKWMDGVLN